MANWYAVYTRPRWEKKVAELLTRRKIENYCPMNRTYGSGLDRRKVLWEPIFSSYVFVRLSSQQLVELKKIEGIVNYVYWKGKPAVIRDIEIEMMRRFLNEHKSVRLEKTPVNVNEIVKVTTESLSTHQTDDANVHLVKLVLPSLGYIMKARVAHKTADIIVPTPLRIYESPVLNIG